jgi:polysaccharide pyruvyl transferase WcaK-like protein
MDISKPKILLTADAALTVTCKDNPETKDIIKLLGIDSSSRYIGFSLRKYPGHEKVEHEKYENVIAALADHMAEKYGLLPVFIPMQYPDDVPILANVAAKMKCRNYIIRDKLNVYDTYEIISKMEIVVAMRLHALVFSAGAGVPMVGLVYDPKIEGFLEYINQASAGDVRYLDFEKLKTLTEDVWKRKELIRAELEKAIPELREKAGENAKIAVELIAGRM